MSTQDVVAVYNDSLQQVFERARPIKATVRRESKPMEHPIETGATITDHRIILPIEIDLPLVLASSDYAATYKQIADLFTRGEPLTVQTRADTYRNLIIAGMPHEESPDAIDAVNVALKLKEVITVSVQFGKLSPRRKRDTKKADRGEQNGDDSSKSRSVLSRIFGHSK